MVSVYGRARECVHEIERCVLWERVYSGELEFEIAIE
jgi:hypothetical protein